MPVRTQLVGTHWVSSVLAALAVSKHCGVPLQDSTHAVAKVPPFAGRMQPVTLPNGATVVRDEENGSPDTLNAMLKVMRESRAERRILIISDISDSTAKPKKRQRILGKTAAELADVAIFMSEWGHHAVRAAVQAGMDADRCHAVFDLPQAAALLASELRRGDLVFLKGRMSDHLSRVLFAQFGHIGCWKRPCSIRRVCDVCSQLRPDFDLIRVLAPTQRSPNSTTNRLQNVDNRDDTVTSHASA